MKIGEVAARSHVSASTLRYYEDIGLIPAPRRVSGQRVYDDAILQTLSFIKVAQSLHFSLKEIQHMLDALEDDSAVSEQWRQLAKHKIDEIDAMIQNYRHIQQGLRLGMDCQCVDLASCELLVEMSL